MGTLYLVATPIGNLEDVTMRALRVLRQASLVAAEDTRTTRKLLTHYGIRQRLLSYNEHNMKLRTPRILLALKDGDVALVSEAGTPGLSDPGHELVAAVLEAGFDISPIPGPAAPIAALSASGLPFRQFTFLGFLPRRSTERRRLFASLAGELRTLVAFEAPHRLPATLADMLAAWGDRRLAVCREMTKAHEEVFRGTVSQAIDHFAAPRGEFTLVIAGAPETPAPASDAEVKAQLRRLMAQGLSTRDAASRVAGALMLPKRRVYELALQMRDA
jgi:16S rRNA (cytidine1402-2'-O)-methyltransferase